MTNFKTMVTTTQGVNYTKSGVKCNMAQNPSLCHVT